MSRKDLTHTLGDAFQRANVPSELPALVVTAQSRGMKLPRHRAQNRRPNRHKKNEGHSKGQQQPRKEIEMNPNNTTQQSTTPATPVAAESKPNVPTTSQEEFAALGQFGEQLGALLGVRRDDSIQWKRVAQDVGVFAAKAGIVTVCAAGVMTLAEHMSKGAISVEAD